MEKNKDIQHAEQQALKLAKSKGFNAVVFEGMYRSSAMFIAYETEKDKQIAEGYIDEPEDYEGAYFLLIAVKDNTARNVTGREDIEIILEYFKSIVPRA